MGTLVGNNGNGNRGQRVLAAMQARLLKTLAANDLLRRIAIKTSKKWLRQYVLHNQNYPRQVQEDKFHMLWAIIHTVHQALSNAKSPVQRQTIMNSLFLHNFLQGEQRAQKLYEEYGTAPPSFLTIGPNKLCNLKCIGCYAGSTAADSEKLSWPVINRIVREKTEFWGSHFTVITGGEPMLYRDEGHSILDLFQNNPDNFFLMFTNATMISEEVAARMAALGNITPTISVEGFEEHTDARRGKGVHRRILQAMAHLRRAGVPYGISLTATSKNADFIISDQLIDYYFQEHGATYAWVFQLMPIGRADALELMVTPEQRLRMFRQTNRLINDKGLLIADFWNCGCASNGCISAGRPGGYLYIEWNGYVTPCVFNPYSPVNINEIYRNGGNLNDALGDPFFAAIRDWQSNYTYGKSPADMKNWITPCVIKDHYDHMKVLLEEHRPKPIDDAARKALEDPGYRRGLEEYGRAVAAVLDPVWESEYLGKTPSPPPAALLSSAERQMVFTPSA